MLCLTGPITNNKNAPISSKPGLFQSTLLKRQNCKNTNGQLFQFLLVPGRHNCFRLLHAALLNLSSCESKIRTLNYKRVTKRANCYTMTTNIPPPPFKGSYIVIGGRKISSGTLTSLSTAFVVKTSTLDLA